MFPPKLSDGLANHFLSVDLAASRLILGTRLGDFLLSLLDGVVEPLADARHARDEFDEGADEFTLAVLHATNGIRNQRFELGHLGGAFTGQVDEGGAVVVGL